MSISLLLQQAGVVGVLRASSADRAVHATLAAAKGGLKAIEVTFTTPDAASALQQLREQVPQGFLLGAGTVMDAEQALQATSAGARFLVSPHLGTDVLEVALEHGVPYVPGVITPTEIQRAMRLGVEVVKLFPIGSSGGLGYLKDLLGPFPDLKCMVTGGVGPEDVVQYRTVGALAVGLGSNLFPKVAVETGDAAAVTAATRQALQAAGLA
ncbi:bifunctional 4-hydroxy-2-oxoglutarate aldolase/2-dehydro-3-deoxy-phosphogluconate aldolase [Deinococcus cellulosilyticus]|uniref:Ketohydroxyglutarate aldolase n=1 Tax=Deinococcus cellulosilyticus (strain DSM 18568 / NBRC 106333 / KACC 11606 / 5516J-15) TaxID=1223518 RepID=A0A511N0C4_DEIC1|nr:bifunctional 4-hydroxy-2-oxoglutarate aldolase/2-dehydro-3-deoxy-phosphogluconate aldolase [Deinococcus cellulosilyticus]GEM46302.1 ketohydroxyglutarate aldolase [Deinococcus cellulosilyticus NBRC 106333 = KACC 11606]